MAVQISKEVRQAWIEEGIAYLRADPEHRQFRTFSGDSVVLVDMYGNKIRVLDCLVRDIGFHSLEKD